MQSNIGMGLPDYNPYNPFEDVEDYKPLTSMAFTAIMSKLYNAIMTIMYVIEKYFKLGEEKPLG